MDELLPLLKAYNPEIADLYKLSYEMATSDQQGILIASAKEFIETRKQIEQDYQVSIESLSADYTSKLKNMKSQVKGLYKNEELSDRSDAEANSEELLSGIV